MKTSQCRIGKIKPKNAPNLSVLPRNKDAFRIVELGGWGEITLRVYDDGGGIENRDALYMLRCAEDEIIHG